MKFWSAFLNIIRSIAYIVVMVLSVAYRSFVFSPIGWTCLMASLAFLVIVDALLVFPRLRWKVRDQLLLLLAEFIPLGFVAFQTMKIDGLFFLAWILSTLSIYVKLGPISKPKKQ